MFSNNFAEEYIYREISMLITEEPFPVKISFDKAHLFFSNPVKVFGLSIRGVLLARKKGS